MTAFKCKYGAFQFSVIPFGLMNAPAMFQQMVTELFGDLYFVMVSIDDVFIHSKSMAKNTLRAAVICERIR